MIKEIPLINTITSDDLEVNAKAKWRVCNNEITKLVRSFHSKHILYLNHLEFAKDLYITSGHQTALLLNAHILYLRFVRDFLNAAGRLTCKGTHRVKYRVDGGLTEDWLFVKGTAIPVNFTSAPEYRRLVTILSEVNLIAAGFSINFDLSHNSDRPLLGQLYIRGKQRWAQKNSRGETNEDVIAMMLAALLKAIAPFSVKLEDYLLAAGISDTASNGLGLREDL